MLVLNLSKLTFHHSSLSPPSNSPLTMRWKWLMLGPLTEICRHQPKIEYTQRELRDFDSSQNVRLNVFFPFLIVRMLTSLENTTNQIFSKDELCSQKKQRRLRWAQCNWIKPDTMTRRLRDRVQLSRILCNPFGCNYLSYVSIAKVSLFILAQNYAIWIHKHVRTSPTVTRDFGRYLYVKEKGWFDSYLSQYS